MRGSERENVGAHVAEGWAGYDVICIKNMNRLTESILY